MVRTVHGLADVADRQGNLRGTQEEFATKQVVVVQQEPDNIVCRLAAL